MTFAVGLMACAPAWSVSAFVGPPSLDAQVEAGKLPPVAERLPTEPLVVDFTALGRKIGKYGGTLRTLEPQVRDTRRMVVFGYSRLVGYTPDGVIEPDIARSVDVEEGRIFTLHLRPGHRWSDGEPFTSEDFRYYWEDVANDPDLGRNGLPRPLLVDGQGPKVSFPDAYTIRYEWENPNPYFLPALAGSMPFDIFRPAHYLRQFHARHAEPEELKRLVDKAGQRNWQALHYRLDQAYKNANVDLPTLEPWVLATNPPADRFVFKRNPYFHRVDPLGQQLPYIDTVAMTIASAGLIPAMVGAGETDLQSTAMTMSNYAFLKQAEQRSDYDVLRWKSGKGSRLALFPNFNAADPVWRQLLSEADFRRALSLAINRDDIKEAVYYGLARSCNDTVLPGSPLYQQAFCDQWTQYDPAQAEALLDRIGLTERDGAGMRLLPDGRPMNLVVEIAGEDGEQTDVLQLIAEDFQKIGIRLLFKAVERDSLQARLASGATLMSVGSGLENGRAKPVDSPAELAPTLSAQAQWPAWGLHYESAGQLGAAPDLPFAQRLIDLTEEWQQTLDEQEKARIWQQMLQIRADEMPTIGIVADVDQVIVASRHLRNLPKDGVYNWEPGAFFGSYRPETFFLEAPEVAGK
ncbi:ABC transporter substrate-binding protein [Aureimonas fodinaquatilis]|uniref:ABC transporter substrate-binding protein n=2 Tax=Aureimonas fodinaquatilis TaxID=2565783 RepID=A0A5B0DQN3_9HYPH|nr:ABC transporter substrate-binding protein [Aureimonas fodinaquatilis]